MKRRSNARARAPAIETAEPTHGHDRLIDQVDEEAGNAVVDDFRRRTARKAMTGVPQAIASIITMPNGSGQSIGNSNASASPRNCAFLLLVDLADEFDFGILIDHRPDALLPIVLVDAIDLGGDLERRADASRDLDRPVGAFLRRNPAEEGEIAAPSAPD